MKKILIIGFLCFMMGVQLMEVELVSANNDEELVVHIITTEFESETEDGKEIEVYRWDPGTVFVPKGKEVTLSFYGVKGKEHPFYIEGTDVKGNVKKGEETRVKVRFDKKGIYRIVCTAHETIEQNGPMIAYIVVK
jgi:plastocyanin